MYNNVKPLNATRKSKWLKVINLAQLKKKSVFAGPISQLKIYFMNTTLHGLRFIADDSRHWLEKTFWLIWVLLSWTAAIHLVHESWLAYRYNPISFLVDNADAELGTIFPSVIVCPTESKELEMNLAEQQFGNKRYASVQVVHEIGYFYGRLSSVHSVCFKGKAFKNDSKCFVDNLREVAQNITRSCEDLMKSCYWNGHTFDCCKTFFPLHTELGLCYASNNIQSTSLKNGSGGSKMISNMLTRAGNLTIEMNATSVVYVLGKEGVPHLSMTIEQQTKVPLKKEVSRRISITEVENDQNVKSVDIEQRNCRFPWENPLKYHPYYSYSACIVECRIRAQMRLCNCTSPLAPRVQSSDVCNITGLRCLDKYDKDRVLKRLKPAWSNHPHAIYCDCILGCEETEIDFTYAPRSEKSKSIQEPIARLCLELERLPSVRYKRNVVHGKLDLVVNIGGTLGLFVGASLLSLVELIHYFVLPALYSYMKLPATTTETKHINSDETTLKYDKFGRLQIKRIRRFKKNIPS